MNIELLYSAAGAGVGAAGSVWFVFRIMLSAMKEDIKEADKKADTAHRRLDNHLQSHQ